ncbi:acyl-CoA transferase|nr:hypothetical protein [Candidatus Pantoea persica]MBA2814528.1 acyl-CoA transferase [Candidatus Pantoea persica]
MAGIAWRRRDTVAAPTFLDTATFSPAFAVSELAAASIGLATQATATLIDNPQPVSVNVRLASRGFQSSFAPRNSSTPALWDPFAGDYRSADGWIPPAHQCAAPPRRDGARAGVASNHDALAQQVARWQGETLEQAIVKAGSIRRGQATAGEPLIA